MNIEDQDKYVPLPYTSIRKCLTAIKIQSVHRRYGYLQVRSAKQKNDYQVMYRFSFSFLLQGDTDQSIAMCVKIT